MQQRAPTFIVGACVLGFAGQYVINLPRMRG
jgi:hypothetical protein